MQELPIEALRKIFSGEIILPTDSSYAEASTVFARKGTPVFIVKPKSASDVALALQFATNQKLKISVRSGGHSGPGFGTNDGGVVIDMTSINGVEVLNAEKRIVRIGSGSLWEDVARILGAHNLSLSSGDTKSVGVGGLVLGGGIGWLVRTCGLTIDSLIACEIVTANGEVVRASQDENPDLFWAIRGGGGNFGIVTTFEFIAQPISKVFAGIIHYGLEDIGALLRDWRDAMRVAPRELNSTLLIMPSFGGNPAGALVSCCYGGDDESAAMKAIAPLENFGTVLNKNITLKKYEEVLEVAHLPAGIEIISQNMFVDELSEELIASIVTLCETAMPVLQIRSLGGKMSEISSDATAFAHRTSEALIVSPAFLPIGAADEVKQQALAPWQSLSVFGKGKYGNLLSTTKPEDITAIYPTKTYERLAKVKKTYDPNNIFNQNYNIKPIA